MKHPYDFESEATALVARMSIDEKASLMSGSSFWHLQPFAQYDLPPIMVSDGRTASENRVTKPTIWV